LRVRGNCRVRSAEGRGRESAERQAVGAECQGRLQHHSLPIFGFGADWANALQGAMGRVVEAQGPLHDEHDRFTAHARKRG
jgi:hypothetical protein